MTKSVLETELAQLDRFNPPNPGLLEAVWIETSYNYTGLDYAIFPIDRTVANTGMHLTTVLDDRQRAETVELEKADRVDIAQKLISRLFPLPSRTGILAQLRCYPSEQYSSRVAMSSHIINTALCRVGLPSQSQKQKQNLSSDESDCLVYLSVSSCLRAETNEFDTSRQIDSFHFFKQTNRNGLH